MVPPNEQTSFRHISSQGSSLDSFHTAISRTAFRKYQPVRIPSANRPPLPPLPRTPPKTSRSRWLFAKGPTPPASPLPDSATSASRFKPDRRTFHTNYASNDSRRTFQSGLSEKSSRSSADGHRSSRPLEQDSHHSLRLITNRPSPLQNTPVQPPLSPPAIPSLSDDSEYEDDWGLDELSEDEPQPLETEFPQQNSNATASDMLPLSVHSSDGASAPQVRQSSDSLRSGQRDTLTLRAFDETPQRDSTSHAEFSDVNNVVGIYADPAAETDDWGDDFVLDNSVGQASTSTPRADYSFPQFPAWLDEAPPLSAKLAESLNASATAGQTSAPRPALYNAAAEVMPLADDALPLRPIPSGAFATPKITHSSLLMYPSIGYQASTVHPSFAKVKDFFASNGRTIRKHFDALVRDSEGTIAFDELTRGAYLLSKDPDVFSLTRFNASLATDVILWKLEWARLTNDHAQRARLFLSLSKIYKDSGDFQRAMHILRDALNVISSTDKTVLSIAVALELEYESAILHRAVGALAEAGRSLMRAMSHSTTLINHTGFESALHASSQRGSWWQLRCKYLRAEIAYDLKELDTAVQFYSEYIMESLSRMIGATNPPAAEQGSIGPEYMRFCLFSPRRLVLALWTVVLCLGEMRCFAAAADVANLTSIVASAFGYEEANHAASNVRSRIKVIGTELRLQYDEISKNIHHGEDADTDELHASSVQNISQMSTAPFDYGVGDLGDVGEDVAEDWDAMLEKELNISIQRCCDTDAGNKSDDSLRGGQVAEGDDVIRGNELLYANEPSLTDNKTPAQIAARSSEDLGQLSNLRKLWPSGPQEGHLIETELRQYLHRLTGTISSLPPRLMYPKPTEPFIGQLMGPKEHEKFLRTFVRSKDPEWCRRITHGLPVSPQWHPSAACKLNFNIEPIQDIDTFNSSVEILSLSWGTRLLESVWKVVRSQVAMQTKQSRLRRLMLNAFSKVAASSKRIPIRDSADRRERLELLGALLAALRLAREAVTDSGKEALWFSRTCNYLSIAAATVTPAAKAAVELFQAESRAHCGVRAVVPPKVIAKCSNLACERTESENELFPVNGTRGEISYAVRIDVPASLRHSVLDLLHALYWQTKAGFDASSASNSMEQLLHAEVASSLFLIGSGISPVDGSKINLTKEIKLLRIPKRRKTKSVDSEMLVDETRRVSETELVCDLQSLWSSLPKSAGIIRAKMSFALAHHAREVQRNYSRAERLLFDGLQSMHSISDNQTFPNSFFSPTVFISPVAAVSSPLTAALLSGYGILTSSHSKYRYGVAALEAGCDAVRVRNKDKQTYRTSVFEVVNTALENNDWRKAISLLHNLRYMIHPKNGLRNEFLHLCILLHDVCFAAGCLGACVVPLRAFSALIYEERLRVLLQRYKRRLAKRKKNVFQRYVSSTPLPKMLPGSTSRSNRKNTLAPFFEHPIVAATIDTTIRSSTTLKGAISRPPRPSVGTMTNTSDSPLCNNNGIIRFFTILRPIHTVLFRRPTRTKIETSESAKENIASPQFPAEPNSLHTSNDHPQIQRPPVAKQAMPDPDLEQQYRELLRIEAKEEMRADSDQCRVELLRIETEYAQGDYVSADKRCHSLLSMDVASKIRCKVLEIMSFIRLKRREINRCLDLINVLEREYERALINLPAAKINPDDNPRLSFFRIHEVDKDSKSEDQQQLFIPQVTVLRLKALIHGGRLDEALVIVDKALELCRESSFWDRGRLHYLRGKVLYAMSCTTTPVFRREAEVSIENSDGDTELILRSTELTMEAFETSSQYFDAAGDELSVAKSDLKWARTCIDFLFRRVVLPREAGGGVTLSEACMIKGRRISISEVQQVVHNVLNFSLNANVPLLLIDAMAALAEVKCIRKQPINSWMTWVLEAWKLFSRLFTNPEDLTVVLSSMAPVSFLMRLRNMCGRLVRLVMCNDNVVNVRDMNKHLRLFEAYVKLHLSIDQKMNLASSTHYEPDEVSPAEHESTDTEGAEGDEGKSISRKIGRSFSHRDTLTRPFTSREAGKINLPKTSKYGRGSGPNLRQRSSDHVSNSESDAPAHRRPAGAFLHMISHEGAALGRKGVSLFINRPREQVMNAMRGNGAVLKPSNFFSGSGTSSGVDSHHLGKDAELIFPFESSLGLGAMQILSGENDDETVALQRMPSIFYVASSNRGMGVADLSNAEPLHRSNKPTGNSTVKTNSIEPELDSVEQDDHDRRTKDTTATHMDVEPKSEPIESVRIGDEADDVASAPENVGSAIEPFGLDRSDHQVKSGITFADNISKSTMHDTMMRSPVDESNQGGYNDLEQDCNGLAALAQAIADEVEHGSVKTNGRSAMFGATTAAKVWAHLHRVKVELKRYRHGKINKHQLQERNHEAVLSWMQCIPVSRKEWNVPESIRRRLVYILYAHGVVGYYAVDRGGSIARISFGGKQGQLIEILSKDNDEMGVRSNPEIGLRQPTDLEQSYLSELIRGFQRDKVWHKNRDLEIVNGLGTQVLRAPRILLTTSSPVQKSRSRPIVMVADLALQIVPWELFFDHVVIRSHCLLDVIRAAQDEKLKSWSAVVGLEDAAVAASRRIVQYINFIPSRKDGLDLERTEEARRQQLAFHGLLRLNQLHASSLISFLDLGGFSDPTAMNAVARPTGPLSSPLSQSRKGIQLFGMRISGNIGKRMFPHLDFIKVSGLGSATTQDLKEAVMTMNTLVRGKESEGGSRTGGLGAHISIFMFSYADLVDCSDSVFGLRREVNNAILMFAPAIHMKVLARHLEDEELSAEIGRVCGRWRNPMFPDITGVARVVIEHVSRFSREKRIPIVVFLGDGLMDVFTNRRNIRLGGERKAAPAAERIVQLSGGGRVDYLRRVESER